MSKSTDYRARREVSRRQRGKVTGAMHAEASAAMLRIAAASVEQHRRAMTLQPPMPAAEALQAALPHLVAIERLTSGSGQTLSALLAATDVDEAEPTDVDELDEQLADLHPHLI